ncbi:hypothetical protein B0F90DRAFT_1819889 [Multifurca ochricompacta]|uniref:Flavin-containing monooxygenase n=1 Tax=Multifurca ochricompacta TaxID=376703 RepID=A0AAD4M019_9AGAM|nr:hypothetical protein B0F90DRAFT_1819889 [Multifurca ochricompacta]
MTPIARVAPTGIELKDGSAEHLDVLICATGFDVSYRFPFIVLGRDGLALNARWTLGYDWRLGSLPLHCHGWFPEFVVLEVEYVVSASLKLQRERLKSIEVKRVAVDDWRAYMETVYMDPCRLWYKDAEGRIITLWPGKQFIDSHTVAVPVPYQAQVNVETDGGQVRKTPSKPSKNGRRRH